MDVSRIESGLPKVLEHMRASGYSEEYVSTTRCRVRRIARAARDWSSWDDSEAWVESIDGYGNRHAMRKALVIARQYDERLVLPRTAEASRHARAGARDALGEGFASVIRSYEASEAAGRKKETTVRKNVSNAASFFSRLEALGCGGVADVTEVDVLAVLTDEGGGPLYSPSYVHHIRAVLRGAADSGDAECGRVAVLLPTPKRWRKVQPVLDESERAKVEAALAGKAGGLTLRDRAIGCLLFYTGMRSCDVAGLRGKDIDWDRDVIETVQSKTGGPLRIPLTPRVGNAIFDYLTRERSASDDPHVFLSLEWPYGPLRAASVHNVAEAVFDAAGVRTGEGDRRGCHIFRRTAATVMLGSGADRAVVASVLGHESAETTDGYMVADVEGLRAVALDVSAFPTSREEA